MKKKLTLVAVACAAVVGAALAAASYSVVSMSETGETPAVGISVGKLKFVQIEQAVPTNGTFVLSRISTDSAVTNALLTVTAVDGTVNLPIGDATNIWVMAGDRLLRSGTVTNACRARLIFDGGN
jgi:hypothetical protein